MTATDDPMQIVIEDAELELLLAKLNHPHPWHSAHEGFAILLEEVDELKAHVWARQDERDLRAMRTEALQVAAAAMRFVLDVCDRERGRR